MKNATKTVVSTFGVIAGLAGIEHGVGEMLQGSVPPSALVIQSWPETRFFSIMDGEPAMTIVPNLLVTGILAVLISLAFIVWVVRYIDRRHGGLVLIGLSLLMLPFGAGFGPPLLGLILGAAATRLHADYGWTRTHIPKGVRRALSRVWPWAYGAAIAAWLFLMPGVNLIDYFIGVGDPMSMMGFAFFSAMGTLLAAIVTGYARDSLNPAALPPERPARLKPVLHKS